MTDTLGKGIANICYVLNPEIVVLGGGIMAQETFLKDRIEGAVKNILYPALRSIQKLHLQKIRMMLGCWAHFIISVECIKRIGMSLWNIM